MKLDACRPSAARPLLMLAALLMACAGPSVFAAEPAAQERDWREAVETRAEAYTAYLQAIAAQRRGELGEARRLLERVLQVDAEARIVRAAKAEVCLEQGDRLCAENEAERAMGNDDAAAGQAHEVLAKLELQRYQSSGGEGRAAGAIEHLARAAELRPRQPWAWNVWIGLLVREGRVDRAEQVARRAASVPGTDSETPWQTFARGLLELGRRDEAIALLEKLSQSGEAKGSLLELMAQLKEQEGDVSGYVDALVKLRKVRPGDAELAHRLGKAHLGRGDPFAALGPLRAAQRGRPGDPVVRRDLATALVELGRAEEAVGLLEQLPSVYLSPHTLFLWVRAEEQLGRWGSAAERLESLIEALAEEDRNAYGDAFLLRSARNYLRADRPADALRMAETLDPSPLVTRLRIRALEAAGRSEEARSRLAELRRERPEDPTLVALQIDQRLGAGAEPGDPALVERALGTSPSEAARADHGLKIALALIGWERVRTGAEILDRLPRPEGCQTQWLRTAAGAYYQARRLGSAERLYREVLGCAPDNHGALNDLCYLLADEQGEVEEALPLCRRAVELQPDEPSYLDSLGWALHLAGRSEEALPLLQRAVAESREDGRGEIREHLGDVYAALGRSKRAVAEWRAALALGSQDRARLEEKIQRLLDEERQEH
jgi:predicted Zn-dependent protease